MPAADNALFYQRMLAVGALGLVAYLLFSIIQPFLGPIAWALLLGFLLQPAQAKLTAWLRGRQNVSAFLLTMAVLFLFVGPLTALAVAFARQAAELAARLQGWVGRREGSGLPDLERVPGLGRILEWLERNAEISAVQVQAWLVEGGQRLFEQLASMGGTAFLGAVGTVLAFIVMLFLLFFFVRDGHAIARLGAALVPLASDRREELALRLSRVTRAVVRGTVVTSMVQGFLLGIAFAIVGLPAPVVFGVVGAIASVVPFGGTGLVWVPAVVTLAAQGAFGRASALLVFGMIVSTVDNFLKPMLISGHSPLPTVAVFIGVLGGLAAFGLIGLFLGPIVLALVLALVGYAREKTA